MTPLITPTEVIAQAFGDGEWVAAEAITEADIAAATERWVRPVVGRELLERVAEGSYTELRRSYLLPVVALYTRCLVQPRLNVATSQLGLTVPAGSHHKAADKAARGELRKALHTAAHTALRRLSDYLDQNAELFTEYDPKRNILKRCTRDGGLIQIH